MISSVLFYLTSRIRCYYLLFLFFVEKYGIENFQFEIVEECLKSELLNREQYYLDTLNPKYNICKMLEKYEQFAQKQKDINKKIAGLKKQKLMLKMDQFNKKRQDIAKKMSKFSVGNSLYQA